MNTYSGDGADLRPCWGFEEVPGVEDAGVIRDEKGRIVEIWHKEADDTIMRVYAAEAHPAEPGAYLLPGGDVPGRVY